jgi:hypothetical protein
MNLKILKEGTIGYSLKKNGCNYNGKTIDKVHVEVGGNPFLIGLNFITFKKPNYEVKSLVYSINYSLSYDRLIASMQKSRGDYEYFCFLRDKNKNMPDEFEILPCASCKTNHTKFDCPKLHFIPITQHVVNKYLRNCKIDKNVRSKAGMRV